MKNGFETAIAFYIFACVAGILVWMNPEAERAIFARILIIVFLALGAFFTLFGKAR